MRRRIQDFKDIGCSVVGCSVDNVFSHLAWISQPRKEVRPGKSRGDPTRGPLPRTSPAFLSDPRRRAHCASDCQLLLCSAMPCTGLETPRTTLECPCTAWLGHNGWSVMRSGSLPVPVTGSLVTLMDPLIGPPIKRRYTGGRGASATCDTRS